MEGWTTRLQEAFLTAFITGLCFYAIYGLWRTTKHVADTIEERKVSRRKMQTKKKEEAQNVSDGVTSLLEGMKAAGVLNDKGYAHWVKKFKSIGLKDVGNETSTGAYWYEPVVHSLHAMRNRLLNMRKEKQRSLEDQFKHCEVK
jgi:hypothetical protein